MKLLALVTTTLLATCTVAPATAQQQPICNTQEVIENGLSFDYKESVVFSAFTEAGRMVYVYLNPDTETWSLVVVVPQGAWCIFGSGEGGTLVPYEPAPEPPPEGELN